MHSIRAKLNARADLPKLRRLFVNFDVKTCF